MHAPSALTLPRPWISAADAEGTHAGEAGLGPLLLLHPHQLQSQVHVLVHCLEMPQGLLVEVGELGLHAPHTVLPGTRTHVLLSHLHCILPTEAARQLLDLLHTFLDLAEGSVDLGHECLLARQGEGAGQAFYDAHFLKGLQSIAELQEGLMVVADRVA